MITAFTLTMIKFIAFTVSIMIWLIYAPIAIVAWMLTWVADALRALVVTLMLVAYVAAQSDRYVTETPPKDSL